MALRKWVFIRVSERQSFQVDFLSSESIKHDQKWFDQTILFAVEKLKDIFHSFEKDGKWSEDCVPIRDGYEMRLETISMVPRYSILVPREDHWDGLKVAPIALRVWIKEAANPMDGKSDSPPLKVRKTFQSQIALELDEPLEQVESSSDSNPKSKQESEAKSDNLTTEPREEIAGESARAAIVVDDEMPVLVKDVSALSNAQLNTLLKQIEPELWEIYKGKSKSWRHSQYRQKGQARASLKYRVKFGSFTEKQQEMILSSLIKVFCKKGNKYVNYVMDVLFPECLVRIVMRALELSYEKAEENLSSARPTVK
eukprot:m.204658 g.204658  ORF g.204658 m.204658 type:complete len:312 (+) comp15776_c0_seq56:1675-2610(+)